MSHKKMAEARRALMNDRWSTNARECTQEFHAALVKSQGAPLREELFTLPDALRWRVTGRNNLFTAREPLRLYGATYASALGLATQEGMHLPDLYVACEHCGGRLRVVNVENTARLLAAHQGTDRCFYRSIVAASVWSGFCPVNHRTEIAYTDHELECLAAFESVGIARNGKKRLWAPMTRVLALTALRIGAHQKEFGETPKVSPAHIVHLSEDAMHDADAFERLQDPSVDELWKEHALTWTKELLFYQSFSDAFDAFEQLAARVFSDTPERIAAP